MADPSNVAAEAVASQSDLLYEILLHLPPESLLNFRIVCRDWYDVISSRQFCAEHTRRNSHGNPTGILRWSPRLVKFVEFDENYHVNSDFKCLAMFPLSGLRIINSCNGLLLCRRGSHFEPIEEICVCNPTTKHITRISTFSICIEKKLRIKSVVLAFDLSEPQKYRVVCVSAPRKYDPHGLHSVDFYESETREWRHCTTFISSFSPIPNGGVFWNGAIYWIGLPGRVLSSFDLKQASIQETMVHSIIDNGEVIHVEACQGHLYLLSGDFNSDPGVISVYEIIKLDRPHLSKKFSISHNALYSPTWASDTKVIGIFPRDEDELFVIIKIHGKVFTLNNRIPIPSPTDLSGKFLGYSLYHYAESLAPV